MRILDCLCGLFRPGNGRRRVHANHAAAVARLAELKVIATEHDGCAEVLDCASEKYADLWQRFLAEHERSMCFEQQLTDLRTELEQAEQRHRREIDRVLNQRRLRTGSNEKTGPIDVRVLRATAAAERAVLAVPPVERTLTMPPLRGESPPPGRVLALTVSPLAAAPAELSPTASRRAVESVHAALAGATP